MLFTEKKKTDNILSASKADNMILCINIINRNYSFIMIFLYKLR